MMTFQGTEQDLLVLLRGTLIAPAVRADARRGADERSELAPRDLAARRG